jgi:serine/threonine protein phosphatase PrpC
MSGLKRPGAAGLTDPGITRPSNEDALLIEPPLYAVADGMGGHRAGEIASRVAVGELLAASPRRIDTKALARAVRAANRAVIDSAEKSRTRTGMGTTLTAAMVDGLHISLAHVGDSRAYLLHEGRLEQLTEDHSMVADLVRHGSITEQDARFHPQRSVITRALGSDANMVADTYEADASPGDRLLLCTDGLTAMLEDGYIAEILLTERDPEAAVAKLVEAANRAGGYDNITVVLVDLEGTPAADLLPSRGSKAAGRRVAARLLWLVAAAVLVAATSWGAWSFAQSRAYLIDESGYVTLYRGIPGSFAGLSLHWKIQTSEVRVDRLDIPRQGRLRTGIIFANIEDAYEGLGALRSSVPSESAPATTPSTETTTF